VPNWGGGQIKKTVQGIGSYNKGAVYDNNGNQMRYPVEKNTSNAVKGALFGSSSFNESRDFYNNERRELSPQQTNSFNKEVSKGKDPKSLYNTLLEKRQIEKEKEKRQNEIKAKFPNKNVYSKKYETDNILKSLNNKLKNKKFGWLKEE
jgi:hypothetical protein